MTPVALNADLIEAFAGTFLSPRYDNKVPTPQFHREAWALYASSHPQCMVIAPREHAKAQPLTSRVLTPYGWRAIGDLEAGDEILGRDGSKQKVTQLHPISSMPVWRVSTRDGRTTRCNDAHLWTVTAPQNTGKSERTYSLRHLLDSGYYKDRTDARNGKTYRDYKYFLPLPFPVDQDFTTPLGIEPYVFGVWLGDGHAEGGRITSADPEIFDYFYLPVTRTYSGEYLYRVEGLTTLLNKLGVLNNKHVPEEYLRADFKSRLALLQGLMDTDGTCHQDGKIAYFCNTNWGLISAVVYLVRSLGGVAVINENETTCNGKVFSSWRVSVKLPAIFNPFKLKRKAKQWLYDDATAQAIVGIEPLGAEECRCISVSGDGHYITDDFMVTHNSTGLTFVYVLAEVLFRASDYVMLVSSTEEFAQEQLGNIAEELRTNEDLIREFSVAGFDQDSKTDIVVRMKDGHRFRILCRGAEQRIRGRLWNGKRPNLLVCDDVEDDEQVENVDRRTKFTRWFFRAAKQALGRTGKTRVHGTILHPDSFLSKLRENDSWKHLYYKAHDGFDDFSNILWPENWPENRLRARRQEFIDGMDAAGYSQEFLNDPLDSSDAFLRRDDFLEMKEVDFETPKVVCAAADFAVSKADKANRTSFTVGGKDVENLLHFLDQRVGRWDPVEWMEEIFAIQRAWQPQVFWVEDGVIWKAVSPMIYREMQVRDIRINFEPRLPIKDKATRGRSLQRRMRARQCRFDKSATWYAGFENELLRFTGSAQSTLDDQFDSAGLLSIGFDDFAHVEQEDFYSEEEWALERGFWNQRKRAASVGGGRSGTTGY